LGTIDAVLAIGSGTLSVDDVSVTVICDSTSCHWKATPKFTVKDIYSFKNIDDDGNVLSRYDFDNNYLFRMFLNMDYWGRDFYTSDSRSLAVSGKHPCTR
jgi:hypothetical protein